MNDKQRTDAARRMVVNAEPHPLGGGNEQPYEAVDAETCEALEKELTTMTARFDEEETNKLRAIGLYDSCKKDLDAAHERAGRADANWKAAEKNLEEMTIAQIQTYSKLVAAERRAEENAGDAEMYCARRMEVFKTRHRIEMPQGRNWKPTTPEDFNAEYDAECDKEIVKQRAARNEEGRV